MSVEFEELLLEEMIEDEDDILLDDFSFIDQLIDEDEEARIAGEENLFGDEEDDLELEEDEEVNENV